MQVPGFLPVHARVLQADEDGVAEEVLPALFAGVRPAELLPVAALELAVDGNAVIDAGIFGIGAAGHVEPLALVAGLRVRRAI
eukprot:15406758-Alexandrium_andersonii.AAC.1